MEFLDEYLFYLETEKKMSKNTILSYRRDIKKFEYFCVENDINPLSPKLLELDKFMTSMQKSGSSNASILRMSASIKSFYNYLKFIGYSSYSVADNMKKIQSKKKAPTVLTSDEIISIIEKPDTTTVKGIRDRAMIETLYASGMKVSEIINVKVSDVDIGNGFVNINSGHNRVVPLYPAAIEILYQYMDKSRPMLVKDENEKTLFLNTTGNPMTRQGFWKILKSYAVKCNIKKSVTPQQFRNSFAASLIKSGAKYNDIKDILGHKDLSSVMIYKKVKK